MQCPIIAVVLAAVAVGCTFDRSGLGPADATGNGDGPAAADHTIESSPVAADLDDAGLDDAGDGAGDGPGGDVGPGPWWDPGWKRRRRLTFLNTSGAEDLVGFPVLVVLDGTRFDYGAARKKGEDLRFVDADHATVLPHEIERWQPGKASHVWVRVPRVDKLSSTDHIWLYHDSPGAPDGQQAAAVWSDHAGVWHLDADHEDSTSHANHAANHGAKKSAGKAAGGQAFSGGQYLELPKAASLALQSFTVTLWIRSPQKWDDADWPGSAMLITRASAGWCSHDWTIFAGRKGSESGDAGRVIAGNGACTGTGSEPRLFSGAGLNDDTWHQVAYVRTPAGMNSLYIDGAQVDSLKDDGSAVAADRPIQVGGEQHHSGGSYLVGVIDELRVAQTARSAAWIDADHRSVNGTLISYGPEQQYGR